MAKCCQPELVPPFRGRAAFLASPVAVQTDSCQSPTFHQKQKGLKIEEVILRGRAVGLQQAVRHVLDINI